MQCKDEKQWKKQKHRNTLRVAMWWWISHTQKSNPNFILNIIGSHSCCYWRQCFTFFPLSALGLMIPSFFLKKDEWMLPTHTLWTHVMLCYEGPLQGCNNRNPKCLWAASWSREKKRAVKEKKKQGSMYLCIACNNNYMHI